MSWKLAVAFGRFCSAPTCETTMISDSAKATRWRSWSGPRSTLANQVSLRVALSAAMLKPVGTGLG